MDRVNTHEDGTPMSEMEIYNSLVGKVFEMDNGSKVTIKKRIGGDKNLHKELFVRKISKQGHSKVITDSLNSKLNQNFEDILDNGHFMKSAPDNNGKHRKNKIVSFETFSVPVYDGYSVRDFRFDVAVLDNGHKVAYAKKTLSKPNTELTGEIKKTLGINYAMSSSDINLSSSKNDVNTQKDTHQYSRGIFGGNSGYEGYSMSKRALS